METREVRFPDHTIQPLVLVRIPAGRFTMGSNRGLPHAPEGPEHAVDIPEFWLADAPVTGSQYAALIGHNPSQFRGSPDLPVESVNWLEVCGFCEQLARLSGVELRMPSEAEWEYPCRT